VIARKVPHMIYGGDYNPEQWPEEVWEEDVRLMREAGVNLVSLGIFSWAKLEPRPGEYDFGWLDRVVDLLHVNGVMVNLATATASPPPWLARLHPESLPVTREGITLHPGARQHYCPSSVAYRERAAKLVRRIAKGFYAGTPVVTRNAFGRGAAYYVGTRPEERYTGLLEEKVCEQAGVEPTLRAPPSLDAVRRKTEDASFLFLLNHGEKTVEVSLPGPGRDLLTGEEHDSTLVLGPLEVRSCGSHRRVRAGRCRELCGSIPNKESEVRG
jgi:beta-galactosidase GanA